MLKINSLKKIITNTTITILLTTQTAHADTLIFASEIIRHGERTPTINLPILPVDDSIALGQLTKRGIQQEYSIGKEARKTYVDKYKLLNTKYGVREIYARSTDFDRTLMSANAFLIGMYPGAKEIQPYAIHTIPRENDNLLLGYEVYRKIIHESASKNPAIKKYVKSLGPRLEKWSSLLKMPMVSLEDLISIGDTLQIRQQLKLPLPTNVSKSDIAELDSIRHTTMSLIFQEPKVGALTSNNLFKEIQSNIEKRISDAKSKKFVLYSAHDVTLLGILSTLKIPLDSNPPYASHIDIMLFEAGKDKKEYQIKFSYNNKSLTIPDCQNKVYCSLDEFTSLIHSLDQSAQSTLSIQS